MSFYSQIKATYENTVGQVFEHDIVDFTGSFVPLHNHIVEKHSKVTGYRHLNYAKVAENVEDRSRFAPIGLTFNDICDLQEDVLKLDWHEESTKVHAIVRLQKAVEYFEECAISDGMKRGDKVHVYYTASY